MTDAQVTMIAGGLALILSVVLMVYYRHAKNLLQEMWAVHAYQASELRTMCSGDFDAVVKIEGQVTCDRPLTAPASGFPCCWCRTRVDRQVVTTYVTRYGVRTSRSWETDYDETITAVFKVTDGTGYTLVDPTNSDLDTESPYSLVTTEREPWFDASVAMSDTGEYRIREELFAPTGYVYVLGQASSCREGAAADVLIHYPSEGYADPGQRFFIISRKSEKELASESQVSLEVCFWAGILGFLFAAYCGLHLLQVAR